MRRIVKLIALICAMTLMFVEVGATEAQFTDMPATHWAQLYVSEMAKSSVITGYPDGSFKPANNVTRAEFAKMLAVASNTDTENVHKADFTDVSSNDWFFKYVCAVENWFNSYTENGNKLFKPQAGALREDIAVALVKALELDVSAFEEAKLDKMFTDSSEISEFARKYVGIAVEAGLISGYEDLTFRPQNTVTRAEAATLLYRAFVEYGKEWVWEDVMCEWAGGHGYNYDGTLYTPDSDDEQTWGYPVRTYMSYTPKNAPIAVNEGEVWKTKLTLSLAIKSKATSETVVTLAPVVICDENDNVIWTKKSESGVQEFEFKIPAGGKKMYLTYRNSQPFTLQKKVEKTENYLDAEALATKKEQLKADMEKHYKMYEQNKPILNENDKAYVIFVVDDLKDCVSTYADMFIERGLPLCLAVPPENLRQAALNGTESRKQVAKRVVAAGGEVLTHHGKALTVENFNFDEAYNSFVISKEMLEKEGFEVNGTILVGGQTVEDIEALRPEMEKWTSYLYKYSDRCGVAEPYWHQRVALYPKYLPFEKYQAKLTEAIENKELIVFYWHDASNISDEDLAKYLDYFKSLSADDIEAVTYKTYYDKVLYN